MNVRISLSSAHDEIPLSVYETDGERQVRTAEMGW